MISDIVLISELCGEELEQMSLQQVYTVPLLSILSSEDMLSSGVTVSVVKLLLKQSTAIRSEISLMPINLL